MHAMRSTIFPQQIRLQHSKRTLEPHSSASAVAMYGNMPGSGPQGLTCPARPGPAARIALQVETVETVETKMWKLYTVPRKPWKPWNLSKLKRIILFNLLSFRGFHGFFGTV